MNKRALVQLLVKSLTKEQAAALLDRIIADSNEDAAFDGYYDITDTFLLRAADHG